MKDPGSITDTDTDTGTGTGTGPGPRTIGLAIDLALRFSTLAHGLLNHTS